MNEAADQDLTALLDGSLGEAERTEVIRRLAADPDLQRRLDALAQTRGSLDAAFAAMLAQAPVARLRAALPKARSGQTRLRSAPIRLAASFVLGCVLGAALAAGLALNLRSAEEDWSTSVVEYMQLYTPETFASLAPDGTQAAATVGRVGARTGVSLTPADLEAPGLNFKTAFVLAYDGAPLGEFVFTDSGGAPYLFCVLSDKAKPEALQLENRQGLTIAAWSRHDRRFLVIGPSAEVIRNWSRQLESRV